ncbi:hypothetical protein E4U21_006839 [Claviceps maximensis]|nr:hypothetical protein E4U21_006839 [Claviceps maximensis]
MTREMMTTNKRRNGSVAVADRNNVVAGAASPACASTSLALLCLALANKSGKDGRMAWPPPPPPPPPACISSQPGHPLYPVPAVQSRVPTSKHQVVPDSLAAISVHVLTTTTQNPLVGAILNEQPSVAEQLQFSSNGALETASIKSSPAWDAAGSRSPAALSIPTISSSSSPLVL